MIVGNGKDTIYQNVYVGGVQFMSAMSGLKNRSLGLYKLIRAWSPASSQYVLLSSLSWKIVMGTRFKVSSERLAKPGIEHTTPV